MTLTATLKLIISSKENYKLKVTSVCLAGDAHYSFLFELRLTLKASNIHETRIEIHPLDRVAELLSSLSSKHTSLV